MSFVGCSKRLRYGSTMREWQPMVVGRRRNVLRHHSGDCIAWELGSTSIEHLHRIEEHRQFGTIVVPELLGRTRIADSWYAVFDNIRGDHVRRLSLYQLSGLVAAICSMAEVNIVHVDAKPSNLVWTRQGWVWLDLESIVVDPAADNTISDRHHYPLTPMYNKTTKKWQFTAAAMAHSIARSFRLYGGHCRQNRQLHAIWCRLQSGNAMVCQHAWTALMRLFDHCDQRSTSPNWSVI